MQTFNSIVIAGGAAKIISVIGVIKYLEEHSLSKYIRTFIGTSAGSILCFMMALGYNWTEMISIINETLDNEEIVNIKLDEFLNVLNTYGFSSGEQLLTFLRHVLQKKTGLDDITFIDFAKLTGKNLVVCVSNITKEVPEFFSVDNMAELSILTAIRISCSLPIIFTPITINGDVYQDGGLYANFPITYLKDKLHDILGVNIISKNLTKQDNFLDYIKFVMYSIIDKYNREQSINDRCKNVITIEFQDELPWISFAEMKVIVSNIPDLIQTGYDAIEKQLTCSSSQT